MATNTKVSRFRGPVQSAQGFKVGSTTVIDPTGEIATTSLNQGVQRIATKTITSTQVLALNATPVEVIAAPGAGKAIVIERVKGVTAGGTAYGAIAAGEDLALRYTNGSGTIQTVLETTGWLDQVTAQVRTARPSSAAGTALVEFTPVADAAIVAHMLLGEITTGDYPVLLTVYYRIVNTTAV